MNNHRPEKWLSVEGYSGDYEVSSLGRVRSIQREFIMSNGKRCVVHGRIMRLHLNSVGYLRVVLSNRNAVSSHVLVHRLVASAFFGRPPKDSMEVNHKDFNRANNSVENLEWVTGSQNSKHSYAAGRIKNPWRYRWASLLFAAVSITLVFGCGDGRTVLVAEDSPLRALDLQGTVYVMIEGKWVARTERVRIPEGWYLVPPRFVKDEDFK